MPIADAMLDRKGRPMITISGYELVAKLGEGPQSVVYRGFEKTAPERPLSFKIFKTTALTDRQRAHYQQKVEHLRVLNDPILITPKAFGIKGGVPFIVQDFFEGLPLDEWTRQRPAPSLDAFFVVACQLATALDKVHEAGIIHGGVKPHNILVHPDTLETRLTGFVTPLDVRDVSHFIFDPAFVAGTLAYTSPEQTGRIHHVVVFSSDLYSLGIVFYELLTGRLPFRSTDPLALIHQHLAEEAPQVHEVDPGIPAALGRLVAKLTLKQPEKRYQSGRGLFADLVRCRTEWELGRSIGRFPLATHDRSRRVVFVSKMVGRDEEARAVLGAYEPATRGEFRSVFISGLPGIGKTRLIQELQQPIVRHRGYFTSGKFDIYQKNIPYSSIIQALRNLIRTFLTESQERIAAWQRRILDVVGGNGRVLIDVIPELEALIGLQPAVPSLPPVEARNRFHGLFDRFLGCLASAESPLTLFIDDLQWCDVASFDFLETAFSNPQEHPYLLLLGAYRHNEVDSSHPLARLIAKVKGAGGPLDEIRLRPLEPKHCHEMVSYILDAPLGHTEALAEFLADLTEGNPLFVSESLSYLYNEDLLYVDDELQWRWDLERIRRSNMPSTVVALFSSKIEKLPQPTVDLLETAACMGNTVAPDDLGRVRDLALLEVFESLKSALGQGLIIENRGSLQFIHDRVQEAVLTAIPADRRRAIHWRVGRKLLAAVPAGADLEARSDLFAIVSHLNLGRPDHLVREEAWRLARINFHAGEKALNALATNAASEFFGRSKSLLPADCWEVEYETTFRIFKKAAKTELMCGRSEQSEALLGELLERARTDLDKAEALAEQTTSLSSIGNFIKAIETANRGLAYFGKSLPDDPADADRRRAELSAEIRARHEDVWSEILQMPFTRDRKSKIELAFYSELIPDLYMSGLVPQLYLSAVQSTRHCLAGGMDESVIYSFSIMGLQLGEQGEFEQAFRYEDLARSLSARHPNTFGATRGMNGIVWCNMHSRSHPEEIVEYCLRGIQCGKNCGDLYNAGLSYGPLMWNLQVQGADFAAIEEYARECRQFSERNNLSFSVGLAEAVQAGWVAPMKKGYSPIPMEDRVARWETDNHVAAAGSYYAHLALSHYYFGEHEKAADALAGVRRCLSGLTDNVLKRQWYVFQALNALKLHERGAGTDGVDRESVRAEIAPLVAEVETWAGLGPLLKPYLAFLHAERERVCGRFERARGLYLDAIESAHRHRYIFLEGHLNECLGEMQLANGRGPARPFFIEAARLYRCCWAERKEQHLCERHPEYFEPEAAPPAAEVEAPVAASYALPQLDVGYLMRSALAISAEIEQEALLRRIMQTVIESSGARHGYMLIAEGDHFRVRAESHAGGDGGAVRTVNHRLESVPGICTALVRYVLRTGQRLVLADASREGEFKDNPQVRALGLRSVLCLPVVKQARLIGALYLENRLAPAMFTPAGIQTTELLAAQAAISLENARLVEEMKRAEEDLDHERENLSVTLHSIGDAVIATDTENRVVVINRVAEELTGWPQAEACGRPLADVFRIVNEMTGGPAEDPVRKALESGAVVGLANHTVLVSRDGRRLSIADSAAPIRGKGGDVLGVVLVFRDVTDARQAEREREVTIELLRIVNTSPDTAVLIEGVTRFFQEISGCEAVGVRLRDGCDYPYYASRGFPQEFVLAENRLGMREDAGIAVKDGVGNPLLDCMCGNVICGRYDASKPFFTARGSFWTNSTTELLSAATAADRLDRMRDGCNGEGHESIALIALRAGEERLGLLQLNDRRKGLFSPAIIEAWERLADNLAVAIAKANAEEALRASLAEKEILLKELAHRTKNNMQVIGGLISLQGSASADKKLLDALADTQDRIRAMALVHENLYRSGNFSSVNMRDYVEDLIKAIFRAQRGADGPVQRNLDVEDLLVSIDAAVPCGLIINELVSNTLKHAFPDRKPGAIYLSLRRRCETTELRYRDDGPGLPRDLDLAQVRSLGLKLVYNLAVRQLRGTMEIRRDPATEFVFAFDSFSHMERM
ncbi:MAG: AAA family ATPase [Gemmatimonadaceae bacterium]|nr:AAA family ATPase [Gemmatimonadaceae bacterium]